MENNISDIYNLILELSWHFGNRNLNAECCGDLSLVEFVALKTVFENTEITIQEIGNALCFTKSGASKIISRLENKGYITRETSSTDGRFCFVKATSKGVDITNSVIEKYSSYIDKMLKDLDIDTLKNIKASLNILVESAKKHESIQDL